MIENPFCTPEVQGAHQLHSSGAFDLEEGGTIPDLQLAYATYGELNEDKDNAIFVSTWFSGTHATWYEDMFFPPRDCRREAELVPGAEVRVLPSIAGHFGLFGFEQTYLDAVDTDLRELLATEV